MEGVFGFKVRVVIVVIMPKRKSGGGGGATPAKKLATSDLPHVNQILTWSAPEA